MSTSTSYLKRFLQTIAVLHIIAGLCFPWIVESPLFDHYREHLHLAFNVQNFNAQQQALFLMALFAPLSLVGAYCFYSRLTLVLHGHPRRLGFFCYWLVWLGRLTTASCHCNTVSISMPSSMRSFL